MRKQYLFGLLMVLLTGLWSCKEDDGVFEQTADERLSTALTSYQKELTEAPYGWKATISPGGGGVYSFYFKFNDKNRVVMYSDFDVVSAGTAKESSYRLKAMQTPSLIFDTYSYLHVLADPDGSVNGGAYGEGLKSDYEFSFERDTLNADNITLTGTKNQSKLVLVKATQEESVAYGNGGLAKSLLFSNISKYLAYFKQVTIGAVTYEIAVSQRARNITLSWLTGTTVNTFTTNYYYGPSGVSFVNPLVNGSQTINGFTDLTWDATKLSLSFVAAGSRSTVVDAIKPLKVDVAAARKWYQTALADDRYWVSDNGFHVNGVDDAFKVNSLKNGNGNYYFYLFWPQYGGSFDAFAPVFLTGSTASLPYWDAVKTPVFTTDGRVIFSPSSPATGGSAAYPSDGAVISSKNLFYDTSGYYLIQLSENAYDMVSARDGKSWISWYW